MIFPEGTRSKDGKLHEGKNGAALILRKTNASVVPCAIIGKPGIFKKVKAVYGKEIDISDIRDNRDLSLITTRIMDSIEKLIKENS